MYVLHPLTFYKNEVFGRSINLFKYISAVLFVFFCDLSYFCQPNFDFMSAENEKTIEQIEKFFGAIAKKYPQSNEIYPLTDIYLQVRPESGELVAFDDDGVEIENCVVKQWMNCIDDNFYDSVQSVLRRHILCMKDILENLGILKPYSFVLVNDDKETIAELHLVDDDTVMLSGELMEGLDSELNDFLSSLLKD